MVGAVMELKELVESTLSQLDQRIIEDKINLEVLEKEIKVEESLNSDDSAYLSHIRERLVVLFDGLQDDEVRDSEAKLELTLNFLEYVLASLDEKLGKD